MSAKTITIYPYNILEDGTITVTGAADTGYIESRLYDRCQNLFWKKTGGDSSSSFSCEIKVDQGGSPKYVDTLIIPKHNFALELMEWQYSSDNFVADINSAMDSSSWTQGDNEQIVKEIANPRNDRYWRILIDEMEAMRCSEVFMSYGYEFYVKVDPFPTIGNRANIDKQDTIGGMTRTTKLGNKKRVRKYNMKLDAIDMSDWNEAMEYLDHYYKPFYFKDHESNIFLASFETISDPLRTHLGSDIIDEFVFTVVEEL